MNHIINICYCYKLYKSLILDIRTYNLIHNHHNLWDCYHHIIHYYWIVCWWLEIHHHILDCNSTRMVGIQIKHIQYNSNDLLNMFYNHLYIFFYINSNDHSNSNCIHHHIPPIQLCKYHHKIQYIISYLDLKPNQNFGNHNKYPWYI